MPQKSAKLSEYGQSGHSACCVWHWDVALAVLCSTAVQCRLKVHAFTIGSLTWGMFRLFLHFVFAFHKISPTGNFQLPTIKERTIKLETSLTQKNSPARQFYDLQALKINVKNNVTD